MSPPQQGIYTITSRLLNGKGEKLAMTFNGERQAITVTPLEKSSSKQQWVIEDFNHSSDAQFIKPKDNKSLEAGWGDAIVPLPGGNYVWNIIEDRDTGYGIKDGGHTVAWTIVKGENKAQVVPVKVGSECLEKQRWIFEKV